MFRFRFGSGTITDYGSDTSRVPRGTGTCPLDVVIPDTIGGTTVRVLAGPSADSGAFQFRNINSVILPPHLERIGWGVFWTNNLKDVVIPDTVTYIDHSAFEINQLTSVTLGSGLQHIDTQVFNQNQLTTVNIPDSVTLIAASAFSNNQITTVTLSKSLEYIGDNAFFNNKITTITIPASVTTISTQAFSLNQLQSIYIEGNPNVTPTDPFNMGQPSRLAFEFAGNRASQAQANAGDYSTMEYTPVYTLDPANPYGYQSEAVFGDLNGDGVVDRAGGVIINPATVSIQYVNSAGAPVAPPVTNAISPNTNITSYLTSQNPGMDNATAFANYYLSNKSYTFSAPAVAGYVTPSNQSKMLALGTNTVKFVYYTQAEAAAAQTPVPTITGSTPTSVAVSWPSAQAATGYIVQYRVKGTTDWVSSVVLGANATNYVVTGLSANTAYEIQVVASQGGGITFTSAILGVSTTANNLSSTGTDMIVPGSIAFASIVMGIVLVALQRKKHRA